MQISYTNEELVEMIRSGNPPREDRALSHIYQIHFKELESWLSAKGLPNTVEAADIFQYGLMAFYRMVQAPGFHLDKSASVKTLLYAICKNRRKNEWRSHFRHEKAKESIEVTDSTEYIVQEFTIKERNAFVADLINSLELRCKKLVGYFYFEKKRHLEIAELMGFKTAQQSRNAMLKCREKLNRKIIETPRWREWIF